MIAWISGKELAAQNRERKTYHEKSNLENPDLEGPQRSGSYRIRVDGRLRCCRRGRHHAGRCDVHLDDLLEGRVGDGERLDSGQLNLTQLNLTQLNLEIGFKSGRTRETASCRFAL